MQSRQDNSKMEIKNIKEIENNLFKRKEVVVEVSSESSPSNLDVKKLLSEKFSVPEEAIKIKKIGSSFGSKLFPINANIYSSKDDLDNVEVKTKKEKEAEKKAEEERLKAEAEAKATAEAEKTEAEKPVEESTEKTAEETSVKETKEEPVQEETKSEEAKE